VPAIDTCLPATYFPQLFQLLRDSTYAGFENADKDPRLAELSRMYLTPLGCGSLLSVPIR
jgi:hypothetical protein